MKRFYASTARRVWTVIIGILLVIGVGTFWYRSAHAALPTDRVDMFFLGDSWTAYPGQSGQTIGSCLFPVFNIYFSNFVKGACSSGVYGTGTSGYPINVAEGYTTEGIVRDRLNARGIPYNKVVKHQFAQAGTLAVQWGASVPANLNDEGLAFLGGIKSQIQDPAVTKPIVWMTLGGNDIFAQADVIDVNDDTNWNIVVGDVQTSIEAVVNYLITLRPDVEIVLPSYANMKIHDGNLNTFPALQPSGFCQQFFAANVNGTMFYKTAETAYNAAADAWRLNQNAIQWQADYNYAYSSLTQSVGQHWWGYYSIYQKQADSANYANNLAPGHNGTNATLSYTQPSVYAAAYSAVNETAVNRTLQRLEPAWNTIQRNHPNNVKHFDVWSTIATDPVQNNTDIRYRSSSRLEFADCIHLDPSGYSYYVDRILNEWLPQSKYLNTR